MPSVAWRALLVLFVVASLTVVPHAPEPTAHAISTTVVINEFRVRGPNGGSDEFVELFNKSTSPVNIGGWTVQGSNSSGTTSPRVLITAGVTLPPGGYYLVTNSNSTGGPYSGATSGDQTYGTGITDDGGIALVDNSPTPTIIDAVGLSSGSAFKEGTPLASLGSTSSSNLNRGYQRKNRCTDTDNNAADFELVSPNTPSSSASPAETPCNGSDVAPTVSNTSPTNGATNVAAGATITVTFSEAVNIGANAFTLECPVSTTITFTLSPVPPGGVTSFTLDPNANLPSGTACAVKVVASQVSDVDGTPTAMATDYSFGFTVAGPPQPGPLRIRDIQGETHFSQHDNQAVTNVPGIVTAKKGNGFWFQDPSPDMNPKTSEAMFVFTSSAPTVAVGDSILVSGTVEEFRPGGDSPTATNLTVTEITNPSITPVSTGNPLPAPIVIGTGTGQRQPPGEVINDDGTGNVETSGSFDPATDGIDFYESLEGMLIQVNNAVVVGPTNSFGEIWVLANNGQDQGARTPRGGIVIRPGDFNPERIQIDDEVTRAMSPQVSSPQASVGDRFSTSIVGVIDYNFGNFELLNTSPLTTVPGGIQRETTALAPDGERVTIGSFNVENLDPSDPPSKFSALAQVIVNNLRSPDILGVEEIQDNDGPTNSSVVAADQTYGLLINAIVAAGGPQYQFRQVNPIEDAEGGEPGGNIRVGFLFNPARVEIEDRVGPGSVPTGTTTVLSPGNSGEPQLDSNPGRLQDPNPGSAFYPPDGLANAFENSRRPLVGEFKFRGRRLFIVNNHFSSKGGDQPLFGRFQPPALTSERQRREQARIVRDFVTSILTKDPEANVVVLGDLNDFHFSRPVEILESLEGTLLPVGHRLQNLIETLPEGEWYTYVFEGNSQALDGGILVSSNLSQNASVEYDVVHVNAEFHDQISDHEAQVVRFLIPNPGQAKKNAP